MLALTIFINNFSHSYSSSNAVGLRTVKSISDFWKNKNGTICRAVLTLGLIPKYKDLYKYLQESGFTLVFKEIVYDEDGKPKGNCDADLVLQVTRDVYEEKTEGIVIVASDGDYASTVSFLIEKKKLITILSPRNAGKCSILLKRIGADIAYIDDQRTILKLAQNEKAPSGD